MGRPLLVWGAVVLLCGAWETACHYTTWDLRGSTPGCVRPKGGADGCLPQPPAICVEPTAVRTLSPKWLSNFAGYGGPLLTWVPLALARPLGSEPALRVTLTWYLLLIGAVRHSPLVVPSGWDP